MTENYKDMLGADYEPIANAVRGRAEQQTGITAATMATAKAAGTMRQIPGASLPSLQQAILHQESGNNDAVAVSPTGAVGPGQIEPATFAQYAMPGENIRNAADNRAVSARILSDYWQRYNGDPYRAAVAYYSGPGNVAPAGSPTPWIHDISYDKQGNPIKPVSSYVTDIAQRIGGGVEQTGAMPHAPLPPHDPYALHAQAMQNVMLDPNLNENERQHAFQFLQRNFTQAQVAAEADTKAKKDANDAGMNDYVSGMLKSGTATPDMMQSISGDPRLTAETKENLYRFATQDFGFEGTSQYGNNYADMYRRIFLPADDPQRITDGNDILKAGAPGGGLTPRGTERLFSVFNSSHKDPDQSSVNQVKSSLIQYAKSKLSFDQEMLFPGVKPLSDPKGVQVFNAQFIPKFESAYDAWVKGGKNPWEFLTQDNVDKLMTGMRPKAQMAMDKVSASDAATGEKTGQPIPPTPKGVADGTWQEIMATRPITTSGLPVAPANWMRALQLLQQDPSEQNLGYFNAAFPGFDGAELLKKLGGGLGAPAAPEPPKPFFGDHPLSDQSGVGPAGYLGDIIRSVTPQMVQDYLRDQETKSDKAAEPPRYSLEDRNGPGPAGYIGDLLRSVVPQAVQEYLAKQETKSDQASKE